MFLTTEHYYRLRYGSDTHTPPPPVDHLIDWRPAFFASNGRSRRGVIFWRRISFFFGITSSPGD
jgi:hypothetical protein